MMRWGIRFFFLCLAVGAGLQLFILKYRVIDKEEELQAIHRQILSDMREIHILQGEWALFNEPERLRGLVDKYTRFQPLSAAQVVSVDDLPVRAAPVPAPRPSWTEPEEHPS